MAVVVFVSAIATFHFYEKDVIARAQAEVPTLPKFEHTNNRVDLLSDD